ncbi:MAG: hypothetical protein CSA33_02315 [Desulfobulbus propionicus]|nr:MAG: hypothetical protein CSA33_02315 [Desulfobulbus propionicus]
MTSEMFYLHSCSVIGFVFHGAACLPASLYIRQEKAIKAKKQLKTGGSWFPSLARLEQLSIQLVVLGFMVFTMGFPLFEIISIIKTDNLPSCSGLIVSTLVVWCLYVLCICIHFIRNLRGRKSVRVITDSFAFLCIAYGCGHWALKVL